jgi:soluble lytic murein transglycosylase-like protein
MRNDYMSSVTKIYLIIIFIFSGILLFNAPSAAADIYYFQDDAGDIYYTNVPAAGRTKVRLPLKAAKSKTAKKNLDMTWRKNSENKYADYESAIIAAGNRYSIDSNLIRAVIKTESNYNPYAVSTKGAMGLMQLMPSTAREMRVSDPFNPTENIYGGVKYLGRLLQILNGDLKLALAAYNAGPAVVIGKNKIPAITETQYYVRRVLHHYRSLNGENGI